MPFTMPSFPLYNREQSSPYANLVQNALSAYATAQQAKYAPRMMEAEIFGKQFGPLAQIASSPLALAMLPTQQKQMAELISQLIDKNMMAQQNGGQQTQNQGLLSTLFGGNNQQSPRQEMPSNGSYGGGFIPTSSPQRPPQFTQNQPPENTMESPPNYNPSLPQAGGNLQTSVTQKTFGPYNEQIHGSGVSFVDPATGKIYSQPTQSTVAVNQMSITAIKRLLPQLDRIARESKEFLQKGGVLNTQLSKYAGIAENMGLPGNQVAKYFGIDQDKFSRYQKWRGDIATALDSFKSSFPNLPTSDLTMMGLKDIIEPKLGESDVGYKERIIQTASTLAMEQMKGLQQGLEPIEISGNQPTNLTNEIANSPETQREGMANVNANDQRYSRPHAEGQGVRTEVIDGKTYILINGKWMKV